MANHQPSIVEGATLTYNEDFSTTAYLDDENTNATGWGDGEISIPRGKNLTLVGECYADNAKDVKTVEVDELDVDRDLEDDQGGVDRYS